MSIIHCTEVTHWGFTVFVFPFLNHIREEKTGKLRGIIQINMWIKWQNYVLVLYTDRPGMNIKAGRIFVQNFANYRAC